MCRQNFRNTYLVLSCWGLLTVISADAALAQTVQQIARKGFDTTVLLVMQDDSGHTVSLGTGFFVGEDEIASNVHVVEGASRGFAKLVNEKNQYSIVGITGMDMDNDLVLIKISGPRSRSLSLANSDAVQVGDPVYAIGNPQGLEGTFSQGIVSGVRQVDSRRRLQITAPISPGSSGGPVLNSKGDVIGVAFAILTGGQNLNFAIPSNYLRYLFGRKGSVRPLATVTLSLNQRSIIADREQPGSKDNVVKNGSVVTLLYRLTESDGTFIESNKGKDPLKYTQGQHQIVPGLEREIAGMKVGAEKHVKVRPEDGYGPVNPNAFQEVPKEQVPPEGLKVGTILAARGPQGQVVPVRIHQIKEKTVVVDLNHPMAGKTLVFDVKVLDIQSPPAAQPR